MNRRYAPALTTFGLLALCLAGCASIFKGPNDSFEVIGPPDLVIEDTLGRELPFHRDDDGVLTLELSTKTPHIIALQTPRRRTIYRLEPRPEPHWALLDLFFSPLNLGLFVDHVTRASYDFGISSLYVDDGDAATTAVDTIDVARRREPLGIIVVAGYGIANPVSQAVLFYNRYHVGIGYQVTPGLAVLGTYSGQGCIDLEGYVGSTGHRPHFYCSVTASGPGLELRAHHAKGIYLVGSVARLTVSASDSVFAGSPLRGATFSSPTTTIGAGLGFAGSYGFTDVRFQRGIDRVAIGGDVTAGLEMLTVTFGLNIVL
jgi:hypothetical protein